MYFRNKFNEEFLLLADNISPKGGSVRLDNNNPLFFEIFKPAFDEEGRYITVIPLLLYNHLYTTYSEARIDNDVVDKDRIIEDWIALCVNRKDCIVTCEEIEGYTSGQGSDFMCNMNINTVTGDLTGEVDHDYDYDYEDV